MASLTSAGEAAEMERSRSTSPKPPASPLPDKVALRRRSSSSSSRSITPDRAASPKPSGTSLSEQISKLLPSSSSLKVPTLSRKNSKASRSGVSTPQRSVSAERVSTNESNMPSQLPSESSLMKSTSVREGRSSESTKSFKGSIQSLKDVKSGKGSKAKLSTLSLAQADLDASKISTNRSKSLDALSDRSFQDVSQKAESSRKSLNDLHRAAEEDDNPSFGMKKTTSPSGSIPIPQSPNSESEREQESRPKKMTEWAPGTSLRVIRDNKASDEDELELEVGEVIELEATPSTDDEYWLRGINRSLSDKNGQAGFFPSSCVELETWEEGEALIAARETPTALVETVEQPDIYDDSVSAVFTIPSSEPEQEREPETEPELEVPKPVSPGTQVTCRFSYIREKADEIELHAGDVIVVLEAPEGGWWRGMTNLGGKEARSGWFPATAIAVPSEKVSGAQSKQAETSPISPTPGPQMMALPPPIALDAKSDVRNSVEDASAGSSAPGDRRKSWYKRLVKNLGKDEKDTKKGRLRSLSAPGGSQIGSKSSINVLGNTEEYEEDMDLGLEPVLERLSTKSRSSVGSNSNVGTGVSPSPSAPSLVPQSRGHKRASSAPSFTLSIAIPGMGSYDKYEHIDVPVSPVSSLNWQERLTPEELASMSSADKKRMTAIWELIVTERDYIRDLRIIIDVFMRPMSENKFGSSKNLDALFSNVDELHAINSEFLQKFEEKLAQESIIGCIGSIFLAMGDSFASYSVYCGNHSLSLNKLQSLLTSNKSFRSFLEETYKNPVTRNLDLGSFLIKPVQRICKYPLLLKEILKHTDDGHRDYPVLKEAMDRLQGIISQVNDGARAAEGVRKMVDVQTSFIEKINIIAPNRYLIREESLHMMVGDTKKPRRLFLFNDLLLIARKDWRDKLHLIEQANLRNCRVSDVAEDGDVRNLFEIEILLAGSSASSASPQGKSKRFLFSASSKQAKMSWLDAYKSVAEASIRKKHLSETSTLDFDAEAQSDEDDDDRGRKKKEELENESKKLVQEEEKRRKEEEEARKALETERTLKEMTENFAEAQKKLEAAEAKIMDLSQTLSELQESIKSAEKTHKIDKETMEHKLSGAKSKITGLEHDLEKVSKEKEAFAQKAEALVEANSKHQSTIQSLKTEIEKNEYKKTSLISSKETEIEKLKRECADQIDRVRNSHKAELASVAAERMAEKSVHSSELTTLNAELQRTREEMEKRSKILMEESEARLSIMKKEAESRVLRLEQDFEIRLIKAQEEAKSKVQSLETTLQTTQLSFKSELDRKELAIKAIEKEKTSETQRLSKELETLKQKAMHVNENLKRALAEAQNQIKENQLQLKDRDSIVKQKEETLREKEAYIAKLEAEKAVNSNELIRLSNSAESAKSDFNRTISNMEKVIQERHQVLSRKEMEISDITQKLSQNMERTNHMVTEFEKLKVEHVERSRISEETIGRLKEELSNLKVERSREHDKLQSLEKSLREATSLYEHARSQHSTLTEANRKFASEHNKYKETITKNHQNIEKLTKENTSINSKIAELSEKLQAKVTELVEVQKHDKLARELLHGKEQELNKTLLRAERAETKLVELERSLERLSKELDSDRQTKNAEIFALKNALKKDSDEGRERLNHELLELKSKLMSESSERHEILIRENQELRQRLEKESNELRDRKSHEEDILRGRLELVERLEKETALNRERVEKENEELRKKLDEIESEYRDRAKMASAFKKRLKELESENDVLLEKAQRGSDQVEELTTKCNAYEMASRAMEGEISLLRSRLNATDKELSALTHRIGMYNELDRRYLELREETIRISKDSKTLEDELKRSESGEAKKSKDIAALMFVLEEISKCIYSVSIVTPNVSEDSRMLGASTSLSLSQAVTSSNLEDIRLLSIIRKVNEVVVAFERQKMDLEGERGKVKDLDEVCSMMRREREANISSVRKLEQRLKDRNKEQVDEVAALRSQLQKLQRELDGVNAEKSKFEALSKEISSRRKTEEMEKDKLDKRLMEAFDRIQRMSENHMKEMSSYVAANTESQRELELSRAQLEDAKRNNDELLNKYREVELDRKHLQSLNQSLLETKQRLQQLLDGANDLGRNLGLELGRTKQKMEDLKETEKEKTVLEEKISALDETIKSLHQDVENRDNHARSLEQELRKYVDQTSMEFHRRGADAAISMRLAVEAKDSDIRQLRIELDECRSALQSLKLREDQFIVQTSRQAQDIKQLLFEKQTIEQMAMQLRKESEILRKKLHVMHKMSELRSTATAADFDLMKRRGATGSPFFALRGAPNSVLDSSEVNVKFDDEGAIENLSRFIVLEIKSVLTFVQNRLAAVVLKLDATEKKISAVISQPSPREGTLPLSSPNNVRLPHPNVESLGPSRNGSPMLLSPDKGSTTSTLFSPTSARGSLEYLVAAAAAGNPRRENTAEFERARSDIVFSKNSIDDVLKNFEIWALEVRSEVVKIVERECLGASKYTSRSSSPAMYVRHQHCNGMPGGSPRVMIKGDSEYNLADVFAALDRSKVGLDDEASSVMDGLADRSFLILEQPPDNLMSSPTPTFL